MKYINSKDFRSAMKEAGMEKVLLVKDSGYFWITSDDEATALQIAKLYTDSIYGICYFSDCPISWWVCTIRALLNPDNPNGF